MNGLARLKRRSFITAILGLPALVLVTVPGQTASAAIAGSTLTFGTVTSPSGVPVVGAHVALIAEPVAMPNAGKSIDLVDLATDVTDPHGNYTLNLPADFTGAGVADPGTGLITFDVLVDGDGINTLTTIETTVTPGTSASAASANTLTRANLRGRTWATASSTATDPNSELAADFTDTTPAPDPVVSYPEVDPSTTFDPNAVTAPFALTQVVKNFGGRWVAVGAWFSSTTGVNAQFAYTNGASSSLGIGVSLSGEFGSFHAEGTHSESTTATQGFPTFFHRQSLLDRTLFTYKEFEVRQCYKECLAPTYKVVATAWRGGSDIQQVSTPSGFTNCVPEVKGSSWHRTNTAAITWTNGVAMANVIGIDLSTQTGYTNEATLDIGYTEGGHRLCGYGGFPGGTPYLLMARP